MEVDGNGILGRAALFGNGGERVDEHEELPRPDGLLGHQSSAFAADLFD